MTMTERTDDSSPDADSTDSDDFPESVVLADYDPLVTVPRPPCDACDTERYDGRFEVSLGDDEYAVCEKCRDHLAQKIEGYWWHDPLTEAHYDRAAEFLRSLDEVWCVKDHAYPGGEMWVHTPYCDAGVVSDVCSHFGFRIRWFSIVQPGKAGEFDCLNDHGPCVEINLDFPSHENWPAPLEYDIGDDLTHYDAEYLHDDAKLFDREG